MGGKITNDFRSCIERPGDLAAILTGIEPGDVLFIDEIHRFLVQSKKSFIRQWRIFA